MNALMKVGSPHFNLGGGKSQQIRKKKNNEKRWSEKEIVRSRSCLDKSISKV